MEFLGFTTRQSQKDNSWPHAPSAPLRSAPLSRNPSIITDNSFDKKRTLRTTRCDQCGELKGGNEAGAFCHRGKRIGLRLKLKLLLEAEV